MEWLLQRVEHGDHAPEALGALDGRLAGDARGHEPGTPEDLQEVGLPEDGVLIVRSDRHDRAHAGLQSDHRDDRGLLVAPEHGGGLVDLLPIGLVDHQDVAVQLSSIQGSVGRALDRLALGETRVECRGRLGVAEQVPDHRDPELVVGDPRLDRVVDRGGERFGFGRDGDRAVVRPIAGLDPEAGHGGECGADDAGSAQMTSLLARGAEQLSGEIKLLAQSGPTIRLMLIVHAGEPDADRADELGCHGGLFVIHWEPDQHDLAVLGEYGDGLGSGAALADLKGLGDDHPNHSIPDHLRGDAVRAAVAGDGEDGRGGTGGDDEGLEHGGTPFPVRNHLVGCFTLELVKEQSVLPHREFRLRSPWWRPDICGINTILYSKIAALSIVK